MKLSTLAPHPAGDGEVRARLRRPEMKVYISNASRAEIMASSPSIKMRRRHKPAAIEKPRRRRSSKSVVMKRRHRQAP